MKTRLFSVLLTSLMLFAPGCSGTQASTEAPKQSDPAITEATAEAAAQKEEWTPLQIVEDLVLAGDQRNSRLVLYNLTDLNPGDALDDAEVWSLSLINKSGSGNVSGSKYREGTVFGDVIVLCASGGYAGIVKYPSKEVVWETSSCGNNPHSIEILPNGNIVCASSTGNTVRLYRTSALLNGDKATANTYLDYTLTDAHGVLWDPAKEVLWGLGGKELVAYSLLGDPETQELTKLDGMGGPLPSTHPSGHDLSADFSEPGYLFITTNKGILHFCKDTNEFSTVFPFSTMLNVGPAKGFGNNPNGNYALSTANGGKGTPWEGQPFASWCTDSIYFARKTGEKTIQMFYVKAANSAFYKVRIFHGQYQ